MGAGHQSSDPTRARSSPLWATPGALSCDHSQCVQEMLVFYDISTFFKSNTKSYNLRLSFIRWYNGIIIVEYTYNVFNKCNFYLSCFIILMNTNKREASQRKSWREKTTTQGTQDHFLIIATFDQTLFTCLHQIPFTHFESFLCNNETYKQVIF